ncbi:MAG: type I-C CRISPR-associated protein Cas5c [Thermoanaerobaculaceae bacterium]
MRGFCLEVSGPYACFTRPEMKVERVSYDVITPSAARAIFDAILWKPAIRWRVKRIEVLTPIRWVSVRRNEVGKVASARSEGIFIEDDRQQRAGLFLRDVRYRLHAEFEMTAKAATGDNEGKFAEMFRRRAESGQCFNQPYLGCREFSAAFRLIDPATEAAAPIPETRDLGWMFYDWDHTGKEPQARFFRAQLQQGVLDLRDVEVRQ